MGATLPLHLDEAVAFKFICHSYWIDQNVKNKTFTTGLQGPNWQLRKTVKRWWSIQLCNRNFSNIWREEIYSYTTSPYVYIHLSITPICDWLMIKQPPLLWKGFPHYFGTWLIYSYSAEHILYMRPQSFHYYETLCSAVLNHTVVLLHISLTTPALECCNILQYISPLSPHCVCFCLACFGLSAIHCLRAKTFRI